MSEHRTHVKWKRETADFAYETYDRSHVIKFEGGIAVKASAAKEFLGKAELANPEELLVGALSSCHMLTFLAVAAKSHLQVDSYSDEAVGTLAKNESGALCVTHIKLSPKVVFSGKIPTDDQVKALHEKAHKHCFIANSVKCSVSF